VVKRKDEPVKISKSLGATSIRQLREAGYRPLEIRRTLQECARRSTEAQRGAVVIPPGVLDVPAKRTLAYEPPRWRDTGNASSYAQEPFWPAVDEYARTMKSRWRRQAV
jgi:hypothetical protein